MFPSKEKKFATVQRVEIGYIAQVLLASLTSYGKNDVLTSLRTSAMGKPFRVGGSDRTR